jgi:hypothetical protein
MILLYPVQSDFQGKKLPFAAVYHGKPGNKANRGYKYWRNLKWQRGKCHMRVITIICVIW